ncbi:hypothetical protein [Amycolatopsis sp. NPDC058986]|uniref:hypothetical protein n=1 Tax=unclassified Amycolatopsis TaxID=2618356 RepID=UPI00366B4BFB
MPDLHVLLIEGLALRQPPPSAATIHRTVPGLAPERGRPMPPCGTMYAIDQSLRAFGQEGVKRYGKVFDLIHRREAVRLNDIWHADRTQLDR